MHEIPGLTPKVIAFADEVVDAGFTVVLPQLFGEAGAAPPALRGAVPGPGVHHPRVHDLAPEPHVFNRDCDGLKVRSSANLS